MLTYVESDAKRYQQYYFEKSRNERAKTAVYISDIFWSLVTALVIAFLVFLIGGWTYNAPVVGGHWETKVECQNDRGPCTQIDTWVEERDYSEAPLYARVTHEYSAPCFLGSIFAFPVIISIWYILEEKIKLKKKSLCQLPTS
jgi:hypothetical protein